MIVVLLLGFVGILQGPHCQPITYPPYPNHKEKDWRSITWQVDTITYPGSYQTTMSRIYASGPDNVYIVGHNDQPGSGTMFRFDSKHWSTTGFHVSDGGSVSGAVSLSAIVGFGPHRIWAVGDHINDGRSLVIFFDGERWSEQSIEGNAGRRLLCAWGSNERNIWAAGVGTVLHYDGTAWKHRFPAMESTSMQFLSIAGFSSSEVYMVGTRPDVAAPYDTVTDLLFRFDGNVWGIIDSSVQTPANNTPRFGAQLMTVGLSLYSAYPSIYKRIGDEWKLVFSGIHPFGAINGRNESDLFAVGGSGQVCHFNGSDWYNFPDLLAPGVNYLSIWRNDTTVFVVGNDGLQTYVLRGK